MSSERNQQIDAYKNAKSAFADFPRFEGDGAHRAAEKQAFIDGETYTPSYAYEKLDTLPYEEPVRAKKTAVYEAILELEAAKNEPGANIPELEIYAGYHEARLKKIMLVEAAHALNNTTTSGEWEVAMHGFNRMNEETYGAFDVPTFESMLATEVDRTAAFEPKTEAARDIQTTLKEMLGEKSAGAQPERPLMSDELLGKLQETIAKRYEPVLAVIPETGDEIYYEAEDCARIMSDALQAGGLAEKGWKIVIDPNKANPTTNAAKRTITLPATTRRNAGELRRLIVHEQEVHARRGENGRESGFKPLESGTADYADVEEGLGVLFECAVAGDWDNASFNRARDRYITAGLAIGADGTPRDARQVYEVLWRTFVIRESNNGDISEEAIEKARQLAYTHVENAFRGTEFWMRGVIYTKLKVYYEGLRKNADFIAEHANDMEAAIDEAMIGKYDHTNERERSDISAIRGAAA
jgi:hypothetical protein